MSASIISSSFNTNPIHFSCSFNVDNLLKPSDVLLNFIFERRKSLQRQRKTFILSHILLIPELRRRMFFLLSTSLIATSSIESEKKENSFHTIFEQRNFRLRKEKKNLSRRILLHSHCFFPNPDAFWESHFLNEREQLCRWASTSHQPLTQTAKLFLPILFRIILNHRDNKAGRVVLM